MNVDKVSELNEEFNKYVKESSFNNTYNDNIDKGIVLHVWVIILNWK